ncbi:MAG: hypothetical protein JWM59_310 [Verrucomicrobiales bacterium]|nr:hypothetical protein [Verrucomicrobiales bacterium]
MVNALGAFYWQVFQGSFHAGRFVEFLHAFMNGRKKPVIIVLDRHPVHTAAAVLREAAGSGGRLRFECLPTYAPELNPRSRPDARLKEPAPAASRCEKRKPAGTRCARSGRHEGPTAPYPQLF